MSTSRLATCPTCRCSGNFEFLGEQHWPPEVARKLGLPEVIRLWSCPNCLTSVSEPDLLPYRADRNDSPYMAAYISGRDH